MDIKQLIKDIKNNKISVEEAYSKLKNLPYEDLDFAKVDHHRKMRQGFPEVIYCQGKRPDHIASIAKSIAAHGHDVLATKADEKAYDAIKKELPDAEYHELARIVTYKKNKAKKPKTNKKIAIITAGTADINVADEARVTAEFLGNRVEKFYDVGVAGIHRLLSNLKKLEEASVLIVVAGMEGALPSVIGGLVEIPIIAVPTSVGYGSNFEGLSALLTMLNSCAPGIGVVNIDNGFGAAVLAHSIINTK